MQIYLQLILLFLCFVQQHIFAIESVPETINSDTLNLEVRKVKEFRPEYEEFCSRWPMECNFSQKEIFKKSSKTETLKALNTINRLVNTSVFFSLDEINYDKEEAWTLPTNGYGDCEDNALQKRLLLKLIEIPKGAMSMATAFHRDKFYAHAILLVETQFGTYVLDQDSDQVLLWHETPYIFEAREIEDNRWVYYHQDW